MPDLLDAWGRPVRTADLRGERAGPTLTGTRSLIGGEDMLRGMSPQRMAAILREAETPGYGGSEGYIELAEAMEERNTHYAGVLGVRKRQVAQIGIIVEPASDAADDVRDADLAREFLARDEIEDALIDMLDALGKGFSVLEIDWDHSERQWMPRRLDYRLPQWFDWDRETGTRLQRRDDAGWTELEPYKFVTHIAQAKSGLPSRGGLARIAAWAWLYREYSLRDWMRFVEAYGQPIRLGRFQPTASPEDRATLERAVRDVAADAAAIIPEGMNIEFVTDTTVRGRAEVYRELLRYLDDQMSIAVLGQTLTTQPGDSGSYSLGQVHDRVRADIERSDARQLAATLQRDIAIPIVTLNHGVRAAYPRVIIRREERRDAKLLAEVIERLAPLGLRVRVDDMLAQLGLSAPAAGDDVLAAQGGAGGEPAQARDAGRPETAGAGDVDAGDAAEAALDAALDRLDDPRQLEPIAEALVGPLLALARDHPADLRARLRARAPEIDTAGLEALVSRVLFVARLWGRLDDDADA